MNLFSIFFITSSFFINIFSFNTKPVKLSNTRFKNSIGFKTIEPIEYCDNNNAIIFCTGASGKISSDIYSQFLSNIAYNNITCYVYNGDYDNTLTFINNVQSKHKSITAIGHSSGSMNAIKIAKNNKFIKNVVVLDPVDDRILYENKANFLLNYIFNKKDNNINLPNIDNFLIIYAGKSYKWDLFKFQIPFIPLFSLKTNDITFDKNVNEDITYDNEYDEYGECDESCCDDDNCNHESCHNEELLSDVGILTSIKNKLKPHRKHNKKIINMPDYGHSDLLDDFWANSAHDTIIKGYPNRNPNELEKYRQFLSKAISIVVNNNMTSFKGLRNNKINFKITSFN